MEEKTSVFVMHPTTNETINVDIPNDTTMGEVLDQLVEAGFLAVQPDGYDIALKDTVNHTQVALDKSKTAIENGLTNNVTLIALHSSPA